jgi:hypothetical protein
MTLGAIVCGRNMSILEVPRVFLESSPMANPFLDLVRVDWDCVDYVEDILVVPIGFIGVSTKL